MSVHVIERLVIILSVIAMASSRACGPVFQDGDRWVAIGDSITHNGFYPAWMHLVQVTRHPGCHVEIRNAGISGDTAAGALRRYDWDIRPFGATVASVMLGMNDVERSLYGAQAPPDADTRRQAALSRYRDNMTGLVKRLRDDGARVILLSPTPYDETLDSKAEPLPGVNTALAKCGEILKEIADAHEDVTFVDLHSPMTRINADIQSQDRSASVVGADRVHPSQAGHLLATALWLSAMDSAPAGSEVVLDFPSGTVAHSEDVEVSEVSVSENAIEFKVLATTLPSVFSTDTHEARQWFPDLTRWSTEVLKIKGLPENNYALFIDGERVGHAAAQALARGIDVSTLGDSPQFKQATQVLALVRERRNREASGLRTIAQVEHRLYRDTSKFPISTEDGVARVEEALAAMEQNPSARDDYYRRVYSRYLEEKPREQANREEIQQLDTQIREAATPKRRHFRLAAEE